MHTPIDFMLSLNWDEMDLEHAKKYLNEWDKRDDAYYRILSKDTANFDKGEREHYRNSINFWGARLKKEQDETQQT